jgi:hypothetical protein
MKIEMFEVEVELGDASVIGGLSVFPLTGERKAGPAYLTGPEAFEAELIQVSELDPPQVSSLAIFNLAQVPILLVEGEMLVGGDQNRTMNVTVLCPPQARTVVPVSCVEAGRWGKRRTVSASSKHAPGSLRAAKTAKLEPRSDDVSRRGSDQGLIWQEVTRQSMAHDVFSETSALDDVQVEIEDRIAPELEKIRTVPGQIGVVCTIGDQVVGLDLFDKPSTLERYLRGIVAGHALDAPARPSIDDSIQAIEHFMAQIVGMARDTGRGVGLGEEILLRGEVAGIGLVYESSLVHLAAFPIPEELVDAG